MKIKVIVQPKGMERFTYQAKDISTLVSDLEMNTARGHRCTVVIDAAEDADGPHTSNDGHSGYDIVVTRSGMIVEYIANFPRYSPAKGYACLYMDAHRDIRGLCVEVRNNETGEYIYSLQNN